MTELEKRIAIYGLRYSYGRMTGAPSDVQEHILNNIDYFKSWELKQIIKEIDEYPNLGMECDIVGWNNFKEELLKNI